MRWMMTWMMAATMFVAISALPGCEAPDNSSNDGSSSKTDTTEDGQTQEGSKEKKSPGTGSGYR